MIAFQFCSICLFNSVKNVFCLNICNVIYITATAIGRAKLEERGQLHRVEFQTSTMIVPVFDEKGFVEPGY